MPNIFYYYFVLLTYQMSLYGILAAPAKNVMSSVCASNGTTYMFFNNEHDVKGKNKSLHVGQTDFKLSPLGCCLLQHRNAAGCASLGMLPICAIDIATNVTRVFNNSCIMEEAACKQNVDWRFLHNGLCHEIGLDPVPCTKVYKPVCAILAGVKSTFSNECLVNAENFRTGTDWRIYSENICSEDIIHHFPRGTRNATANPTTKKNNSSDLNKEIKGDVIYINTVPQFETEFINNAYPSMVHTLLKKNSSLSNIMSVETHVLDTHDYIEYTEETEHYPNDFVAIIEDAKKSSERADSFDKKSLLDNPVEVSTQFILTQNISSIPEKFNATTRL